MNTYTAFIPPPLSRTTNIFAHTAFAAALTTTLCATCVGSVADTSPRLSLAKTYHPDDKTLNLSDYWVSEKYDGVRAVWDGRRLLSRSGNVLAAPDWFIAGLPAVVLDGELWSGRGQFAGTVSIVRKQHPHDGWRRIRFMVFDLPAHPGTFRERLARLQMLATENESPFWQVVQQVPVASHQDLQQLFDKTIANGGEGLMLRRKDSYHHSGRSEDLLKYKPFYDAEAVVIGHNPGNGKYIGMTGSLRVRTPDGRVFNVGSGLSDAQRKTPPPIGVTITYRYQGLTRKGLPRFPVYLRTRHPAP